MIYYFEFRVKFMDVSIYDFKLMLLIIPAI